VDDLRILESVIAVLLLIYIVRPFVRKFRGVDGLSVLPGISLLLSIAAFPSFGFRPELLPLVLFSFAVFVAGLPRLADMARGLRTDDYGDGKPAFAVAGALVLAGVFAFAFVFSPVDAERKPLPGQLRFSAVDPARGLEVSFILEGAESSESSGPLPLVVFGSPTFGSTGITDSLRAELASRGYAVLSYYRVGFDFPAETGAGFRLPFRGHGFDAVLSLLAGGKLAVGAEAGARLERERLADLRFAVGYARALMGSGDERFAAVDSRRLIVAGYGSGGAAALLYGTEVQAGEIEAVAAIESPVRFYLEVEPELPAAEAPEGAVEPLDRARLLWSAARGSLRVRKTLGPARAVPAASVPTLMLVSDWVRDLRERDGRYASLIRVLRAAESRSALASIAGAGPVHFSDAPIDYPAYVFFVRGKDRFIPRTAAFAGRAAAVVDAFLRGTLESGGDVPGVVVEFKR